MRSAPEPAEMRSPPLPPVIRSSPPLPWRLSPDAPPWIRSRPVPPPMRSRPFSPLSESLPEAPLIAVAADAADDRVVSAVPVEAVVAEEPAQPDPLRCRPKRCRCQDPLDEVVTRPGVAAVVAGTEVDAVVAREAVHAVVAGPGENQIAERRAVARVVPVREDDQVLRRRRRAALECGPAGRQRDLTCLRRRLRTCGGHARVGPAGSARGDDPIHGCGEARHLRLCGGGVGPGIEQHQPVQPRDCCAERRALHRAARVGHVHHVRGQASQPGFGQHSVGGLGGVGPAQTLHVRGPAHGRFQCCLDRGGNRGIPAHDQQLLDAERGDGRAGRRGDGGSSCARRRTGSAS